MSNGKAIRMIQLGAKTKRKYTKPHEFALKADIPLKADERME